AFAGRDRVIFSNYTRAVRVWPARRTARRRYDERELFRRLRDRVGRGSARPIALERYPIAFGLLLDAIQVIDAAPEERSPGNRRRGPGHLVERVLPQHLEFRTGLDHHRLAVVVQAEDLALVGPGRCPKAPGPGGPFAVGLLARPGVVTTDQAAALVQDI